MGWTLRKCRDHFGAEFMPATDDTHYFHVGPLGRGLGEHVYLTFDPDGTVGGIQWVKLDGKASLKQRFNSASEKHPGLPGNAHSATSLVNSIGPDCFNSSFTFSKCLLINSANH